MPTAPRILVSYARSDGKDLAGALRLRLEREHGFTLWLKVWDLASERALATLSGHDGRVTSLAMTPDGARAVTGSDDSTVNVWDLASGRAVATLHADGAVHFLEFRI